MTAQKPDNLPDPEQLAQLAELMGRPAHKLSWNMRHFFGPCLPRLKGARILDVGCGKGSTAFYAALCGASEIIALEPEAEGSATGSVQTFLNARQNLSLEQCHLEQIDFLEYQTDTPFDIVVLYNSVNHIREVQTDIKHDPAARNLQQQVIAHIARMIRPDGWVVLCDCARSNLFGDLGRRSPFAKNVNFKKHQNLSAWRELLIEAGFGNFNHNWYVPYLVPWARLLLDNALANYFTFSYFVLRGRKL